MYASRDLRYNNRTVRHLTQRILLDITPVSSYIQVNESSDTSVKWELLIEVDSFRSLKEKRSRQSRNNRKDTKHPHRTTSPSQLQDASTISSINSSKIKAPTRISPSQPPSQSQEAAPLQIQRRTAISPTEEKPLTLEIIITNEKSLTAHDYSELKITALQEIERTVNELTKKGKEEIG